MILYDLITSYTCLFQDIFSIVFSFALFSLLEVNLSSHWHPFASLEKVVSFLIQYFSATAKVKKNNYDNKNFNCNELCELNKFEFFFFFSQFYKT